MSLRFLTPRLQFLSEQQNPDGGWGYLPGRLSRVEPTTYALRALLCGDSEKPQSSSIHWQKGIAYLLSHQQKDGGFNPGTADATDAKASGAIAGSTAIESSTVIEGSTWVSSLVLPLLQRAGVEKQKLEAAAEWLLRCEGAEGSLLQRFIHAVGKSTVDQDPRLRAWPWRPGNHSWVEPTSHALLALPWLNGLAPEAAIRYRKELGEKMLLDRRCEDGGWNYGNKRVLGEVLPSYPETTALALLGLLQAPATALGPSLETAATFHKASRSAYAASLLTLALRLHGKDVSYQPFSEGPHPSRSILLAGLEVMALTAEPRKVFLP